MQQVLRNFRRALLNACCRAHLSMLACDRSLIDTRALPTPGWCRSLAVAEHWSPRKCSQYWQSSGRGGPKMCVWQDGACVGTLAGHTYNVLCLAVLPGGTLASGSGDTTVRLNGAVARFNYLVYLSPETQGNKVRFWDKMVLREDGTVLNTALVTKFGIPVAKTTVEFRKPGTSHKTASR